MFEGKLGKIKRTLSVIKKHSSEEADLLSEEIKEKMDKIETSLEEDSIKKAKTFEELESIVMDQRESIQAIMNLMKDLSEKVIENRKVLVESINRT